MAVPQRIALTLPDPRGAAQTAPRTCFAATAPAAGAHLGLRRIVASHGEVANMLATRV